MTSDTWGSLYHKFSCKIHFCPYQSSTTTTSYRSS